MKLVGSALLVSIFYIGLASAAPATPTPLATGLTAEQTADEFHQALTSGDSKTALALLDDNVQIFEQGWVERSRSEYAGHHLPSDMAFSAATKRTQTKRASLSEGESAYVTTEGTVSGTFKGKAVNSITLETMVLRKAADGWKIVHIHWSSRDAKK